MKESNISTALSFAALSLLGSGSSAAWEVDSSYLSYVESDKRVSVAKTLVNLTRQDEHWDLTVGLVSDTMSGASPTGAIRSSNSAVTFTGASGSAAEGSDYSKSTFDDHRKQASLSYERKHAKGLVLSYGGAVSQESDYDSYGVNMDVAKTTSNKAQTYQVGIAYTQDTIFRSDTGTTPLPLSNMQSSRVNDEGGRVSMEGLLGYTRVLNRLTLAQVNLTLSQSEGYHSDPYKIISAADENDRIVANYYDSRPDVRLRASLFGKLVHQIRNSKDSIRASYRFYLDDWGIDSHTIALRYRHVLSARQFLEPHVRLYSQGKADFYQRKLQLDMGRNPILPDNGLASADYRLDNMTSTTVGVQYGFSATTNTRLRLRAEYLDQRFSTADFSRMNAVILQGSVSYSF